MRQISIPENCEVVHAQDLREFQFGDFYIYYHPNLDKGRPLDALLVVLATGTSFEPNNDGHPVPSTLFAVVECSTSQYVGHTWHIPNKHFTRLQQFKIFRPLR